MKNHRVLILLAGFLALGAFFHDFHLRKEFRSKTEIRNSLLTARSDEKGNRGERSAKARRPIGSSTSSHIAGLLAIAERPLSLALFDGKGGSTWTERHLALAGKSEAEVREFAEGLENPPASARSLQTLRSLISRIFPSEVDLGVQIEEVLKTPKGQALYYELFHKWLRSDQAAAQKWLDKQIAAGTLEGRGINDKPLETMLEALTINLFLKSPDTALSYYNQVSDHRKLTTRMVVAHQLVQAGDDRVGEFLAQVPDRDMRLQVLHQLVRTKDQKQVSKEKLLTTINQFELPPEDQQMVVREMISRPDLFKNDNLSSRLDWIKEASGQDEIAPYLSNLVTGSYRDQRAELESWAATESDPTIQDSLYENLSRTAHLLTKDLQTAAEYLSKIEDPVAQRRTFQNLQLRSNDATREELDKQLVAAGLDPDVLKSQPAK